MEAIPDGGHQRRRRWRIEISSVDPRNNHRRGNITTEGRCTVTTATLIRQVRVAELLPLPVVGVGRQRRRDGGCAVARPAKLMMILLVDRSQRRPATVIAGALTIPERVVIRGVVVDQPLADDDVVDVQRCKLFVVQRFEFVLKSLNSDWGAA